MALNSILIIMLGLSEEQKQFRHLALWPRTLVSAYANELLTVLTWEGCGMDQMRRYVLSPWNRTWQILIIRYMLGIIFITLFSSFHILQWNQSYWNHINSGENLLYSEIFHRYSSPGM